MAKVGNNVIYCLALERNPQRSSLDLLCVSYVCIVSIRNKLQFLLLLLGNPESEQKVPIIYVNNNFKLCMYYVCTK